MTLSARLTMVAVAAAASIAAAHGPLPSLPASAVPSGPLARRCLDQVPAHRARLRADRSTRPDPTPSESDAMTAEQPSGTSPETVARRHLATTTRALGLTDEDLAEVVVTSELVSDHSGVTHVYLRQRHQGIDIVGAEATVNLRRDGTILSAPQSFVARVAQAVNTATPTLDATAAVVAAAKHLELPHRPPRLVSTADTPPRDSVVAAADLSVRAIPARLVYHIAGPSRLRLAWELEIERPDSLHWWVVTVDAATGDVLDLVNRVLDGAPAGAR